MGIIDPEKLKHEVCDMCGLIISRGEYVLMNWGCPTKGLRKDYCVQYHAKLLEMQKRGAYDYDRVYWITLHEVGRADQDD
jgi:hypothetical protein